MANIPAGLVVGCTVHIEKQDLNGLVHYVGPTKFGKDPNSIWVGIELKVAKGKHNGTLKGEKYFSCPPLHGMFARLSAVKVIAPPAEKTVPKVEPPQEPAKKIPAAAAPPPKAKAKIEAVPPAGGSNNVALENELAAAKVQIVHLRDELEMAHLDNEMAVEEGKDLRDQVMDLQDRLRAQPTGGASVSEPPPTTSKSTPDEAAKLKEALIQLRDAWVLCQDELEVTKMELNEDRRELQQLKTKYHSSASALAQAQQNVMGMSSQISGAADSDAMIEFLTNKNLELENQKKELMEELQDMTKICELSDEVAEAYLQSERDTSLDLDAANETILEMHDAIQTLQSQNNEFRTAVPKLRAQIADLHNKQEEESESGGAVSLRSQEEKLATDKKIHDLEAKLASNAKKGRSQVVDKKLATLEREQAASNLRMMKNFLPDSFFNVEYGGIELVLFLNRVAMKCDIVSTDTIDQYKLNKDIKGLLSSEADDGITIEQTSFAHDVVGTVASIKSTVTNIAKSLRESDDTTYRALSTKYLDVQGHEACIDELIECIKADKLGPQFNLVKIKTASRQFEHLRNLVGDEQVGAVDFAADVLESIDLFNKAMAIELTRLGSMFSRTSSEGEKDVEFDNVITQLTAWTGSCDEIEKFCRKANSKLVSPDETKMLKFDETTRKHLLETLTDLRGLSDGVRATCKAVWDYTHSSATLKALSLDKAMKMAVTNHLDLTVDGAATTSAKAARAEENMIPLHAKVVIQSVLETLKKLYDSLEHGAYDVDKGAGVSGPVLSPWEVRGTRMKDDISESLGYKQRLEDAKKENLDEKKKTMAKQRKLDELNVKIQGKIKETNTYKSQLQSVNQQQDGKVKELNEELLQLKKDFETERNAADDEIADLDKELRSLKKKYEGRAGAMAGITDMRGASIQIHTLKEALRVLKMELAKVRGAKAKSQMLQLDRLIERPATDKDKKIMGDVNRALLELKLASASPLVIDVTNKRTIEGQISIKKPILQLSTHAARLHALCTRSGVVADAATELIGATNGTKAPLSFGNFATPSFTRALAEDVSGYKAAVIRVPKLFASDGPAIRKLSVQQHQLKMIHTEFLR